MAIAPKILKSVEAAKRALVEVAAAKDANVRMLLARDGRYGPEVARMTNATKGITGAEGGYRLLGAAGGLGALGWLGRPNTISA